MMKFSLKNQTNYRYGYHEIYGDEFEGMHLNVSLDYKLSRDEVYPNYVGNSDDIITRVYARTSIKRKPNSINGHTRGDATYEKIWDIESEQKVYKRKFKVARTVYSGYDKDYDKDYYGLKDYILYQD